jgi:hypothetical protein
MAAMSFREFACGLATLSILAATGCPDSKRKETGNAVVELHVVVDGSDQLADLFENGAAVTFRELILAPLDEGPMAALGEDVGALTEPESNRFGLEGDVDLKVASHMVQLNLPTGRYAVRRITHRNHQFNGSRKVGTCANGTICDCDDPNDPASGSQACASSADCAGPCTVLPCGFTTNWDMSPGAQADYLDLGTLDITGTGQVVTLRLNGPQLALRFIETAGGSGDCAVVDSTEAGPFAAAASTYLSLE